MKFTAKTNKIVESIPFYLIGFAVLVTVIYCFSEGISGNDFWWHIKVGEYICNNKSVPTTGIFSWIGMEEQLPWTAHEWLADVIFYFIYNTTGPIGIFCISIIAALLMIMLMWHQSKQYIYKNILVTGVFFALFAVLTSLFFYGRPHVFGFFLLFFELKVLFDYIEGHNEKNIYWIPVISILWSNLHGGSSCLVYILCIVFLLCGSLQFQFGRIHASSMPIRKWLKLGAISLLSILGIMINPIGLRVLVYPYVNMADNLSMTIISEWQAPDAKMIGNLVLYFLPILLTSIGLLYEKEKIRLIDIAIMLVFLFLFFRSARFIILWYISAIFYSFRYLPPCKVKPIHKKSELVVIGIMILLLIVPIGNSINNIYTLTKQDNLISRVMSDDAIAHIKEDKPQRIFNDYNLGEALIYNDIPVFFDARADLYAQESILADGVSLLFLEQASSEAKKTYVDVDSILQKYQFDRILVLKTRPLYSYLIGQSDKFNCLYEDNEVGYFKITGLD